MTTDPARVGALWASLRTSAVDARAWLELAQNYAVRSLFWQAGYAARQALRCDPALRAELGRLAIVRSQDVFGGDALLGRTSVPEAAGLAKRYSAAVAECPGDWLTWLYLGRLAELPDVRDARLHMRAVAQARKLEAIPGETFHWLGVWRLNAGDARGAIAALSELVNLRPLRHGSMMYLGDALLRIGNIAAAEKAFTRASLSSSPDFLLALAHRVHANNYWREAIAVLRKALKIRPAHVPTWLALAKIQSETYALSDCRESIRQVREREPENAEAAVLEAGLLGRCGDARAQFAALQAAYESSGNPLSRLASSLAMTSLYDDALRPAEVAALHRRLCAPIQAGVAEKSGFANPRSGNRRLRIGYVTGDLHRQHPVNIFALPVLLRHDHARFEVCVYQTGSMHDEYTMKARKCVDRWLEASNLDDVALQKAIVADGVDILIDLAGHTATHRLGVFALRAAPVQATYLGYPHSTGLTSIDWLIGDRTVAPVELAQLYSEGIAQLPGSVFCWASVDEYALPKPRSKDARLVFGSFNNAMKLSPSTVALWATVLKAAPESQLLLKAPSFRDEAVQARFRSLFSGHGIRPERLMFRGPSALQDMMQEYGDMDIALDPVPYNGGTTTLQALWMGVPVITLAGGNFAARMGASILRSLDRPAWIAKDEADYLAKAASLAGELEILRRGRARQRKEMAESPLCDIQAYVGHLEALYRRMWAAYRDGGARRILEANSGAAHAKRSARPRRRRSPGV